MAAVEKRASLESGNVSCSVCLEHVSDVGERSFAKLKCGHHFHLDCIGSAFNAKGSMQCPNCRHVEEGRWLYANGCRSHEDFNFDDLPSSYEDDYEVYAGIADMLHPHHELQFGHFQWCPYQSSYPQFSVTLEEIDPPTGGYPDVIVNVLYGDHGASANPQHVCPYLAAQSVRHSRRLDDQVVVVHNQIDIPGGPLAGNPRGPQSFAVPERTGWASQSAAHIPASTGVGMMNDVGLSSLPNDRFRWSVPASRSDPSQVGYNGQSRPSENSGSSWHTPVPCPQHGYGGSSPSFPQNVSPRHGHGNSRRTRPRGFATSSSSATRPLPTEPVRPFRAPAWPTASSMGPGQDLNPAPFSNGVGWHGNNQSYPWRRDNRSWGGYDLDSQWRPWFQTSGNVPGPLDSASGSYHPELVYGDASLQAGQRVAPEGHYGHSGFPGFSQAFPSDGQPPEVAAAHLRPFMQPPR